MKKKIIIAIFFAGIMLMLPTTSALKTSCNKNNEGFNIPLSEEDEKELRILISREEDEIENELNKILTDEGELNIDELELIYENYLETGDSSVIESDSWTWILDRLGWIYLTIENVMTLYNDALALYAEITQGSQVVQNWYQGVLNLRDSWQAFKQDPLNFNNIKNLLTAAVNLIQATIALIDYVSSQDLIDSLNTFIADVQNFVAFLQSNPWTEPIIIYGNVTNVDEPVTVSVKSDSETTTGYYDLTYTTSDSTLSWFVHKCQITAEYKGKKFTETRYALSMGKIEFDIDKEDFKGKSKEKTFLENYLEMFPRLQHLFQKLLLILG